MRTLLMMLTLSPLARLELEVRMPVPMAPAHPTRHPHSKLIPAFWKTVLEKPKTVIRPFRQCYHPPSLSATTMQAGRQAWTGPGESPTSPRAVQGCDLTEVPRFRNEPLPTRMVRHDAPATPRPLLRFLQPRHKCRRSTAWSVGKHPAVTTLNPSALLHRGGPLTRREGRPH